MMRILIAQTTRMGDVLQTSPLIQQVRDKYPDAHITAMVRRMGCVIAERHPAIDELIVYDEDRMFMDVKSKDSLRLLKAYQTADKFIRKIRDGNYDIVYNVTHSIASAMMHKLAGVPKAVGADLSDDGQFMLRGNWTTYFFTSVYNRDYNDLNLCDITRNFEPEAPPCRRLVFDLCDEDRAFARDLFQQHGIGPDDFIACFQLGASEENKRWSEARFAALARRLAAEKKARILLLGITEEGHLGEKLEEHAPGLAVHLYGTTTIPQLAAILERANILVTNDTGTMHIAAAVGCPITLVSVGHVHYRETGPYGPGHCAVEFRRKTLGRSDYVPGGDDERERLPAESVAVAVDCCLQDVSDAPIHQFPDSPELEDVDLFMTRFAPDGCLQFYPVIRRPMLERDFVRIAYRTMWLDYLNPGHGNKNERESVLKMLHHYEGPPSAQVQAWRKELDAVFSKLAGVAQRGIRSTEQLLSVLEKGKGMAKAKEIVSELMALDEESRILSEIHPAARPLISMARFERDNLEGADPLILAKTTLDIYRACFQRARLTQKKISAIAQWWSELPQI